TLDTFASWPETRTASEVAFASTPRSNVSSVRLPGTRRRSAGLRAADGPAEPRQLIVLSAGAGPTVRKGWARVHPFAAGPDWPEPGVSSPSHDGHQATRFPRSRA